jgi:hypothetical protein
VSTVFLNVSRITLIGRWAVIIMSSLYLPAIMPAGRLGQLRPIHTCLSSPRLKQATLPRDGGWEDSKIYFEVILTIPNGTLGRRVFQPIVGENCSPEDAAGFSPYSLLPGICPMGFPEKLSSLPCTFMMCSLSISSVSMNFKNSESQYGQVNFFDGEDGDIQTSYELASS